MYHKKSSPRWILPILLAILVLMLGVGSGTAQLDSSQSGLNYLPVVANGSGAFESPTLYSFTVAPESGSTFSDFKVNFPFKFKHLGLRNNPCTLRYDRIKGSGEIRLQGNGHVDDSGQIHLRIQVHIKGEGADWFGLKYHVMNNTSASLQTGLPLTVKSNFRMISQGSTDNFVVNFSFMIAPNLNVTFNLAGPICRG